MHVSDPSLSRRSFLTFLAAVPVWLALPSGLVQAATLRVRKLRHWTAPDHTRLVLDLDGAAAFESRLLRDPERVVLEIRDGMLAERLDVTVQDGLVARVYSHQLAETLLVVVELQRNAEFTAFALPPNAGADAHRIVLDVRKRLTAEEARAQEREANAVRDSGDTVVAIDAGHGGNDPGCISPDGRVVESAISLQFARRLAKALEGRPRVRPVLTRERDYFVPLGQRPRIAQRFGAKLFISIHANSAPSRKARGAEIFFLSLQGAADKAARELVDRENAADLVGGLPPGREVTPLVDILMNLTQNNTMRQSERLGEAMLQRCAGVRDLPVRGLKQGPLAVLKSIASPSVLVELGFVTNPQDAELLLDGGHQKQYAQALATGIVDYLEST
jgi:N-acetylmuramoyl-L-alanine amidase